MSKLSAQLIVAFKTATLECSRGRRNSFKTATLECSRGRRNS